MCRPLRGVTSGAKARTLSSLNAGLKACSPKAFRGTHRTIGYHRRPKQSLLPNSQAFDLRTTNCRHRANHNSQTTNHDHTQKPQTTITNEKWIHWPDLGIRITAGEVSRADVIRGVSTTSNSLSVSFLFQVLPSWPISGTLDIPGRPCSERLSLREIMPASTAGSPFF